LLQEKENELESNQDSSSAEIEGIANDNNPDNEARPNEMEVDKINGLDNHASGEGIINKTVVSSSLAQKVEAPPGGGMSSPSPGTQKKVVMVNKDGSKMIMTLVGQSLVKRDSPVAVGETRSIDGTSGMTPTGLTAAGKSIDNNICIITNF